MRLIVGIVILLLTLTGCTGSGSEKSDNDIKDEPTKITLTPVDLFEGDGAKFELFLGPMSGAFKLRYEGKKPNAILDIDLWQNGKKVDSYGSIGDLFFSSNDQEKHEVEIIISIDTPSIEGQNNHNVIKVGTIYDTGSSLSTVTRPSDKKMTGRGLIQNNKPLTFTTEDSVHVWGMHATSTNMMYTADFSPESLSRLEQAIIFTLRFEE
jgi:hypothetical protein